MKTKLIKSKLSSDGQKVLKLLETTYGMTHENAIRLMQDGGTPIAVALLPLARGVL